MPNDNDLDWLAGRESTPPHSDNKAQVEWRRENAVRRPEKKDYSFLIGIAIMIVVILLAFWITRNDTGPDTAPDCTETGAC